MDKVIKFHQQREKTVLKLAEQYYRDMIIEEPSIAKDYVPDGMQDEFQKYCVKRYGGRYKWIIFTVNFKPKATLGDVIKKVTKCVKKKWITRYLLCYETRNHRGEGIHIHMKVWLEEGKKPYDCKREMFNTFKNLVENRMHVNCRYSNRDGCFEEYIKGIKGGEKKQNYEFDRVWRKEHGLTDVYCS